MEFVLAVVVEHSSQNTFACMEDEEIVHLAKLGRRSASEFLISRYRPMVETKARAYFVMGADQDDVIQEGMIGLCKAIRDFQDAPIRKFRSFAELCVTRQIITAVKTATRQKHQPMNAYISLDRTPALDCPDALLMDVLPQRTTSGNLIEVSERLPADLPSALRDSLSDLERGVLRCYLDGKSYREMSAELSCRTKTIDNALQRIKRKMGILVNKISSEKVSKIGTDSSNIN